MNILFTSNRFFPDIGGIESVSSLLASYFVEAGHSLRLITQSVGDPAVDRQRFNFSIVRQPSFLDLLACYRWSDLVYQNNIELFQIQELVAHMLEQDLIEIETLFNYNRFWVP